MLPCILQCNQKAKPTQTTSQTPPSYILLSVNRSTKIIFNQQAQTLTGTSVFQLSFCANSSRRTNIKALKAASTKVNVQNCNKSCVYLSTDWHMVLIIYKYYNLSSAFCQALFVKCPINRTYLLRVSVRSARHSLSIEIYVAAPQNFLNKTANFTENNVVKEKKKEFYINYESNRNSEKNRLSCYYRYKGQKPWKYGVFADFCPISSIPQAVMKLPSQQHFELRKEEQQLNIITPKAFIDFWASNERLCLFWGFGGRNERYD